MIIIFLFCQIIFGIIIPGHVVKQRVNLVFKERASYLLKNTKISIKFF